MIKDAPEPEAISAEERALWHLGRDDFWRENRPERFSPDVVCPVEDALWRLGGLAAVELWVLDLGDKYRLDLVVKPPREPFAGGFKLGNYAHARVVGLCSKDKIDEVAVLWGGETPKGRRHSNAPRFLGRDGVMARIVLVSPETLMCAVREAGKQPKDALL